MKTTNLLRAFRSLQSCSQERLAEKVGVSQSSISRLENNKRPLGDGEAEKLAMFFKVGPENVREWVNSDLAKPPDGVRKGVS